MKIEEGGAGVRIRVLGQTTSSFSWGENSGSEKGSPQAQKREDCDLSTVTEQSWKSLGEVPVPWVLGPSHDERSHIWIGVKGLERDVDISRNPWDHSPCGRCHSLQAQVGLSIPDIYLVFGSGPHNSIASGSWAPGGQRARRHCYGLNRMLPKVTSWSLHSPVLQNLYSETGPFKR